MPHKILGLKLILKEQRQHSKCSSIDDKIDPFHYYTTLIKFGIGRATYDAAKKLKENY